MAVKARKYNPKKDYGTRGSEVSKFTVPFAGKRATVYRRKDSGASTWHMRVYLPEEGIHYRRSLRTSDRREALEFAQLEFIKLMALEQQGLRVTSPTFIEACRAFTKDEEQRLADGLIRKQTYKMHQFYISRGIEYINHKFPAGIRTRLSEIDGRRDFSDYLEWRQQKEKALRTSVEAELNGIRMVFKFAVKQRRATEKCIPQWEWDAGAPPRRRRMYDKDYPTVLRTIKAWVKKATGDVDTYNRRLLHHVFLVIASMGGRTGEVLGLRNSDIQRIDRDALEVLINIRKETSKAKKDRMVTVMPSYGGREGGKPINYLLRWLDEFGFYPDSADTFTKPHTGRKECPCRSASVTALSTSGRSSNWCGVRGPAAARSPWKWASIRTS